MFDVGRVLFWMVVIVGGLVVLGLLSLFFFGVYLGLGFLF